MFPSRIIGTADDFMGRGAKPLSQLVKVKASGRAPVSVCSSEVGTADRTAGWNSSCGFDHANTLSRLQIQTSTQRRLILQKLLLYVFKNTAAMWFFLIVVSSSE